jgi:hypothetical protein
MNKKKIEENIVKGYQGIMDLDLSLIDKKFWDEVIKQHHQEIEDYKKEQCLLPEKLRYENTVAKALHLIETDRKALTKNKENRL